MRLDLAALGARLQNARLNKGLSQESVAESLQISRQAVIQIEQGVRYQLPELWRLAELYGTDLQRLLSGEPSAQEDSLLTLFRIQPDLQNQAEIRARITRIYELFRIGLELERELDEPARTTPTSYDVPPPSSYAHAVAQGRELAVRERRRLSLGFAPIHKLSHLVSVQGIWAAEAELPDQFSGLFLSHDSIGSAIIVNCRQNEERRRFSFAHEYAHALADKRRPATVTARQNASDLIEKRANVFASEFLMPSGGVQEALNRLQRGGSSRVYFGLFDVANDELEQIVEKRNVAAFQRIQPQDVALLAKTYHVSYQVATYKLVDMQVIGRSEASDLLERVSSAQDFLSLIEHDTPRKEPSRRPSAPPPARHEDTLKTQMARLLIEAYRRRLRDERWISEMCEKAELPSERLLRLARSEMPSK